MRMHTTVMSAALATVLQELLSHPSLVLDRSVQVATVLVGYQQENKYRILDGDGRVRQ